MIANLKPCPFCGHEVEVKKIARDWYRLVHPKVEDCFLDEYETTRPQSDDQLEYLIQDWNRRAGG